MTVILVALCPLAVLPYFVGRTAGGICILPQLCSDNSYESAAGFQRALPQGPLSQPPLSAALPNNLPGHGATSSMWEKYLVALPYTRGPSHCSLPLSPWKAGKPLLDLLGWQHLCSVRSIPAPATFAQQHPLLHSQVQVTHQPGSTEKFTPELWKCWFYEVKV